MHFITGNANKFAEAKAIIPQLEQLTLDLPEVQSLDPKAVIHFKLEQAATQHEGECIVEDTSLSINCLNGLPGTFIKYFLKTLKPEGIYQLIKPYPDHSAIATTTIGYRDTNNKEHYFEGSLTGIIVKPEGGVGFGWDSLFQPDGYNKTFAQMGIEQKNQLSMRRKALEKLKKHLESAKP